MNSLIAKRKIMKNSKKWNFFFCLTLALSFMYCGAAHSQEARALIEKVAQAVGGNEKLQKLGDVECKYTYHRVSDGKKETSIERYLFAGEKSWARYLVREIFLIPDIEGQLIQGYDGQESWATLNGKLLQEPQIQKITDFSRKTNYYWFVMNFKLLDPGLQYEMLSARKVAGKEYQVVKITFDKNVGDAQDTYVLYINPDTFLVDQFLFTVMDFGMAQPNLMKVQYAEVEGLKLPVYRKYAKSDWEGNILDENWAEEISEDIKFNNGFAKKMFVRPVAKPTE